MNLLESDYKKFTPDEIDNLLSQFLISSWSYSRVTQFARNQKAFEMLVVYNEKSKMSATTIAGQAYHISLQHYFISKKEGEQMDLATMETYAYDYIDEVSASSWKLQKTTSTVEECKKKAFSTVTSLLKNFYTEKSIYEEEISEILDIEVYCNEWLNINGVDIPMPCHAKIDLVVQLKNNKVAIIDHKSKMSFTSEEEMKLSIGIQAITYVKSYESKEGISVDEVWFVENKFSQNRDGSPQLVKFALELDENARVLYEDLLYEPLNAMITAVNDPNFIYLINESDNFIDKAEIYAFWAKTRIAEIGEFDIPESKKHIIEKRLRKTRDANLASINPNIIKNFRQYAADFIQYDLSNSNMTTEQKIEHVLRSFGVITRVAHKFEGYSSDTYLLEMSAGTKVTSVHPHRLDIANVIGVNNVRVSKELTVLESKAYLSIDFSKKREESLIFNKKALINQRIPIGKDNFGNVVFWDLENNQTPHALVCGSTGSGKSVCIKSTIEYAKLAGVTNIYVFDPKYEFLEYRNDKSCRVFNDIEDIEIEMAILVEEMNDMVKNNQFRKTLIVIDEFADAISQGRKGKALQGDKSLEENVKALLQKSRSIGFRVMAGTQRASAKVITGDAKANFPVVICFRVPKEIDSRVVLDEAGAESLSGSGDGLIKSPEYPDTIRFQGYYKPSKNN